MKYLRTLALPPSLSCFRKMLSLAGMVLLFTQVTRGEEPEYLMWKSKAGTQMEAKLVSCEAGTVVLEKRDGKRIQLKLTQLAEDDQARAQTSSTPPPAEPPAAPAAAPVTGETSIPGLNAAPGKCSAQIACGDAPQWTYQLYLPSGFHTGRKWPVCFLMSPGGGSSGTIKQYTLAAEQLEMILAVSRQSKNDFPDSDLAMMAMLKDVYKRVPVMKDMAIASRHVRRQPHGLYDG